MVKSPEQQLYDAVFKMCMQKGYATFDHLPPDNDETPYPFVMVGGMNTFSAGGSKLALLNNVKLTVDVWGNDEQRLNVSNIADDIYLSSMQGINTQDFIFSPRPNLSTKQLMQDTSIPNITFNRAMLMLVFSY